MLLKRPSMSELMPKLFEYNSQISELEEQNPPNEKWQNAKLKAIHTVIEEWLINPADFLGKIERPEPQNITIQELFNKCRTMDDPVELTEYLQKAFPNLAIDDLYNDIYRMALDIYNRPPKLDFSKLKSNS